MKICLSDDISLVVVVVGMYLVFAKISKIYRRYVAIDAMKLYKFVKKDFNIWGFGYVAGRSWNTTKSSI